MALGACYSEPSEHGTGINNYQYLLDIEGVEQLVQAQHVTGTPEKIAAAAADCFRKSIHISSHSLGY